MEEDNSISPEFGGKPEILLTMGLDTEARQRQLTGEKDIGEGS